MRNNTFKAFVISIGIHLALVGAYLYNKEEKPLVAAKEKIVTIDLHTFTPPKQNIEKSEPKKEEPKKVEKPKPKVEEKPKPEPKPIEKPKPIEPKHKPIIKEKAKPKPKPKVEPKKIEKPIEKPVEKPIEKKVIQKTKTIEPKPTNTPQDKAMQQQAFIKTNFEIIRDMVLENLTYPSMAKRMGWQGVVKVQLVIDTHGKLVEYHILESSKEPFNNAVIDAVESLIGVQLPKPKESTIIVLPIRFNLH